MKIWPSLLFAIEGAFKPIPICSKVNTLHVLRSPTRHGPTHIYSEERKREKTLYNSVMQSACVNLFQGGLLPPQPFTHTPG